ncbi:hypothetical protein NIES4103_11620 [Nostoc sp. NIES-4103]|nr:hypothetical protein NIES4103_11620 [Nostoc sp. NIES-4103]
MEVWFRPYVWTDYWLAILFTVVIPLILLIWAFVQKAEAIQRLLMIYWRVASLLLITIYLMIARYPISFITGLMALVLIPISLWFWADLNDEIEYQPSGSLKLIFNSWRWAATVYCILSAIAFVPFVGCALSETAIKTRYCSVWFEAPLLLKEIFHLKDLGFIAILALVIYVAYLSYFVLIRLGKQGRSATTR